MEIQKKPYNFHAIQLLELRVSELSIKVDLSAPRDSAIDGFAMESGRSTYDSETHQIQVKVSVSLGKEEQNKAPFALVAELYAMFEVDESRFDVKFVEDWADKNAPLVLYPYVRELVYSLTSRAGFPEVLLPLLEIPTFRAGPPIENAELGKPTSEEQ